MSRYPYRVCIIINGADRALANAIAAAVTAQPADALTFGPPALSATGQAPATHCAVSGLVTEAQNQAMLAAMAAAPFTEPARFWTRSNPGDGLLYHGDSSTGLIPDAGQPWSAEDSLAAAGLQPVATEETL